MEIKLFPLFTSLIICGTTVYAQQVQISRSVIGSTGNSTLINKALIQYTIGEPVITTFQNSIILLSQGFQQPEVTGGIANETHLVNNYILYPNPTVSQTQLEFNLINDASVNIQIINNAGQTLRSTTINMLAGKIIYPIALTGFASGLYYVVLKVNQKKFTEKLIIQ
jgi:hypothetical protein